MGLLRDRLCAKVDNHEIKVMFRPVNVVNPLNYLMGLFEIELKINNQICETKQCYFGTHRVTGIILRGELSSLHVVVTANVSLLTATYKLEIDNTEYPLRHY